MLGKPLTGEKLKIILDLINSNQQLLLFTKNNDYNQYSMQNVWCLKCKNLMHLMQFTCTAFSDQNLET